MRLHTMENAINRHNNVQAEWTANLESKLKAYNERLDSVEAATNAANAAQSEMTAELNLKIKTTGTYHEELLSNKKYGLQDALRLIEIVMKLLASPYHAVLYGPIKPEAPIFSSTPVPLVL